ncbi:MAG TPA: hypothetical protein VJP87_01295 [Candidatus Acidoferrales bacterium]|nr:hypothetical protein [Candidatus Acidoferrales bacterium]
MPSREEAFLPDELLRQLMSVGEVDLIVGIRAHHEPASLHQLMEQAENICLQTFVRDRIALVGIDGHRNGAGPSSEEEPNPSLYRRTGALRTVHRLTIGSKVHPADGTMVRQLFTTADLLRAKAVAMISPSSAELPRDWLLNLLCPLRQEKFDYVAPLYRRHWNQGLLIRTLLYPMTRAVFGYRIREMYSEDFAFSGSLLARSIDRDFWQNEAIHSRTESWMAVQALETGMPVCQAFLGQKDYPVSASGAAIVDAIRQAVGTLFSLMETHQSFWMTASGSRAVRTIGPEHELLVEPVRVNRDRLFEMFHVGVSELAEVLAMILSPETHAEVRKLAAEGAEKLAFPMELWVRILYEFAAAYHRSVIDRDHLVQALVPLYRGKIGSFFEENRGATPETIEAGCEALCLEFERQKPYLIEKWNATREVPL